ADCSVRRFAAGARARRDLDPKRHMLRLFAAVLCASVTLAPAVARACSVCGCGDPLLLARDSMAGGHTLRFALEDQYLSATGRSDDAPERTETLNQMTLRPVLVYSPVSRINLVLQVPLVRKDWALSPTSTEATETAVPMGLGDVDFGIRFFIWDATSIRA